jgi:hypothetical protein
MTTEPTTDRAAWLEEVRADVDKANSPTPVNGRYGAELRIVERHAPALLHALEAVEALIAPQWRSIDYDRNALVDDLRAAIDRAREA